MKALHGGLIKGNISNIQNLEVGELGRGTNGWDDKFGIVGEVNGMEVGKVMWGGK